MPVDLLLDAPPVLVVNKPGGLLTQSPPGIDSLEDRVRAFEKARAETQGNIYLGVPHRLDRPASGAIAFTRNVRATRRLADQFAARVVEKTYWALLEGKLEKAQGSLTDYMRKIPGEARSELVDAGHEDARLAILHYLVVAQWENTTWVQIRLETGRTHQIRLQMSSIGCPIQGDSLYGAQSFFGPTAADVRDRWIALHARQLSFLHPKTQERVTVVAPLPDAWLDVHPDSFWYEQPESVQHGGR